tara:strand:- start:354 stop:1538 length:1185 start_codon:yes stop_codon:yes gene_type:complete
MNLHEYQAKELLKKFNLPILEGKSFESNLEKIEDIFNILNNPPWVVKSQIHAGGRGAGKFKNAFNQKGGVQVINNKSAVIEVAKLMMGNTLITKQTGDEGKKVNRIFIEEGCEIEKEFYISLLIDRNKAQLMMMLSASGGMNIEEVAENYPEKIMTLHFPSLNHPSLPNNLQDFLQLNNEQFQELKIITKKLVEAFISLDASTIEINPLVINKDGKFLLLDAKLILDDNALFRHPELEKLKDFTEENILELEASKNGMNYVKLNGSIGCMVNGAGLAMATMDMIKQFGKEPANFLDLGGTANKERAIQGFKIIQSDQNVKSVLINIFGGIIRCDMIANGIVEAIEELNFKLPLVVRFQGTNAKQGRDVLNNSSGNVTSIDDLALAAQRAVELAT